MRENVELVLEARKVPGDKLKEISKEYIELVGLLCLQDSFPH